MKSFLFAAALFSVMYSGATILTVSNSPSTTLAQFNTIQAAIDASASGDTVFVHGSPVAYSAFTITNKQLVIIGPGWNPDKASAFTAQVSGTSTISGSASSNTEIQGMYINLINVLSTSGVPANLRFVRNKISQVAINQSSLTYSGYVFEGNAFAGSANVSGVSNSTYQNFIFRNNYFYSGSGGVLRGFSSSLSTILLDHNLIFAGDNYEVFNNCQFLLITNNIFVKVNPATNLSNSTFNNNITFNCGNNTPWLSNGNIDAGGNVANQNPQMVAQASVNAGTDNFTLDFTIASGPADNAGSDGKDMGLLYDASGGLNWANSRNSRIPRIYSFNIANPVIPQNGILNINVEARKSN